MGGMGTSTQSSTENSQTTYPTWTQDAYQNTYTQGSGMLENFLRNPQYAVAGMNTDQMKAFDLARDTARSVYTADPLSAPGNPNFTTALSKPASMSAAQVTPGAISQFMNPYLSAVLDPTVARMRGERDNSAASIGAKYAAQGGLGGSGEALARGQLERSYGENLAQTTATLMAQGYDKATATALANAQFQQQASQTNAQFAQQSSLANAAAQNTMQTTAADYGLKSTQVNDQLRTNQQARELAALQQILQGGNQQQKFAQTALDVPWTALERLFGLTPKQLNSQTISQKEGESTKSPIDTVLGVGSSLFGGGSGGILGGIKGFFGGK